MNIKTLIRHNILSLSPYSTARDEYTGKIGTFLDANESPFDNGYNRYPDPRQKKLKELIGKKKGISPGNIFLGNGSDEAIDLLFRIFCVPGQDNAIALAPSYGMYEVAGEINDVAIRKVLLNNDFSLPVDRLLEAADGYSKLLFICSPNNPTGNAFAIEDMIEVMERFNGIVVVDEAYIDFSDKAGLLGQLRRYPNLVILQTLSKAWGMAGLRCGLALASEEIIEYMDRVKYPYNINLATAENVVRLLEEPIDRQVAEIKEQREMMTRELSRFDFVKKVYPSDANFLLVKVVDADDLYGYLITNEIIVRNRNRMALCDNCLRLTVGTREENRRVLDTLKTYRSL